MEFNEFVFSDFFFFQMLFAFCFHIVLCGQFLTDFIASIHLKLCKNSSTDNFACWSSFRSNVYVWTNEENKKKTQNQTNKI